MEKSEFKYISVSELDKKWGLFVTEAGHLIRKGSQNQKDEKHPAAYQIKWRTGRILLGYQLIYIVKGKGLFEYKNGRQEIHEGDLIFLYPGEWHRYKPDMKTGWESFFIGFSGTIINELVTNGFFSKEQAVRRIGFDKDFLTSFIKIIEIIKSESIGYQQIASGILMHLLGELYTKIHRQSIMSDRYERQIQKAKMLMLQQLKSNLRMQYLAIQIHMSYSLFRKEFKKYTGFAPGDFYLDMKIQKARELLISTNKSIKEIGLDLFFSTHEQFSKTFKKRTGETPGNFRKRQADKV